MKQLQLLVTAGLWATAGQCHIPSVDIKHSQLGEYLIRRQIKTLEKNLFLDMEHLPGSYMSVTEAICGGLWIMCPAGITFSHKKTLLPGKQANGTGGTHQGLNVSLSISRQPLRRARNTQSGPVSISRQQQTVTIASTSEGWNFGAQLSGSVLKGIQPSLLGAPGVSISASYSRYSSSGSQMSVADGSSFSCPPLFDCWSEAWVPYVTISGPCKVQAWHECGNKRETCSSYFTRLACEQFHHWKAKVCPLPETCNITTPVMEGDRPWVTEVYFEEPLLEFHPKPVISGYHAGYYLLSSGDYRYDPVRTSNRYWTPKDDWHDNRAWPSLDDEIAKFNHSVPRITSHIDGCYRLDTMEWYCPWTAGDKHYWATKGVPYAKPTAPDPSTQDIADFLQLENGLTDSQVMREYLKLFNREHGLDMAQTDFNARNKWQQTPLIWGVVQGHEIMAMLLLGNLGVNVTATDLHNRTALSWAAAGGYVTLIRHITVVDGSDINFADDKGRTPLSWAVQKGHDDVIQLLLRTDDVDVTVRDKRSLAPLWWAAYKGNLAAVKGLAALSNTSSTVAQEDYWSGPLYVAAEKGHAAIVSYLAKLPWLDINLPNNDTETALILAVQNGHADVVKELLMHPDIDVNKSDRYGNTPLAYAVDQLDMAIAMLLLSAPEINPNRYDRRFSIAPLLRAIRLSSEDMTKLLLATGKVDVNIHDYNGKTPVVYAIEKGFVKVARWLLDTPGINVDFADNYGRTPLAYAAKHNQVAIARMLLDRGADPTIEDAYQVIPLERAAENDSEGIIKLLLGQEDVNVDHWDAYRTTLLGRAVKKNDTEFIAILLSKNADPNLQDQYNQTPFTLAALMNQTHALKLLLAVDRIDINHRDQLDRTALSYLAEHGNTEILRLLMARHADPNIPDAYVKTPLVWAAEMNHVDAVLILLTAHNINVNHQDSLLRTALSYAAELGNADMIRLLLTRDADPNIEDQFQKAPLNWAAYMDHYAAVKMLIRAPYIDPNHRDQRDSSALAYAVENENVAMVRLLVDTGIVDPTLYHEEWFQLV
ncbi:hypothetical protein CDD82_7938 [Ophiocordyceps australis]|uniref:Uncharacterized protein n=1 Tax=Ophiocordyceps australis TaxID=1399860 RepID=A0A2C5YNK9_9HYPO|nr:hypothetical protein CDD82_7938 [Ophiocordyceps australis]